MPEKVSKLRIDHPMNVPKAEKGAAGDRLLWDITVDLLQNGNMARFQAPGTSMSPFIRHHEIITVKPCSDRDIRFGDIILYSGFGNGGRRLSDLLEAKKCVHRFLGRREVNGELRLITKGDNNYLCDPPVSPQQILGRVVEIEKNGWRLRLDTPFGRLLNALFALVIMPPVSALSFACIRTIKRLFTLVKNNRNSSHDCAKEIRRRQL